MSMESVRDALVEELSNANIGAVEGRRGRVHSLPWEGLEILPLWNVSVKKDQLTPGMKQPIGSRGSGTSCFETVFSIRGYFPHSFEEDSETTWLRYLDTVSVILTPSPALGVCSITIPPTLLENDFIFYGEVLCHFATFEFHTQSWR